MLEYYLKNKVSKKDFFRIVFEGSTTMPRARHIILLLQARFRPKGLRR